MIVCVRGFVRARSSKRERGLRLCHYMCVLGFVSVYARVYIFVLMIVAVRSYQRV